MTYIRGRVQRLLVGTAAVLLVTGGTWSGGATAQAKPNQGTPGDINTLAGYLSRGYNLKNCAPQPLLANVVARLECNRNPDPSGPAGAQYFLFAEPTYVVTTFKNAIHQPGVNLEHCGNATSPTTWVDGTSTAGQVACVTIGQQGGVAEIIWTNDARNMFGFVRGTNPNLAPLYQWWQSNR